MGKFQPLNFYGKQLSAELVRLRVRAGLDQHTAGETLHLTFQKISRLETVQVPGYHELDAILNLYGASDDERETCHEWRELARQRGWWRDFGISNNDFVSIEDVAAKITVFQLGHLPPLLQTGDYARALARCEEPPLDDEVIHNLVAVTVYRQKRLTSQNPLILHAVIPETVINATADYSQIQHLISLAEFDNVSIQILPDNVGLHCGLSGSMALAEFPGDVLPDQAYVFKMFGIDAYDNDLEADQVRASLENLVKLALGPDETIQMLRTAGIKKT